MALAGMLKWSWGLAALLVLLVSLKAYDGTPNSDAELLLDYAMLALSFPLGWLIAAVFALVAQICYAATGYIFTTSYASIVVTWLILFATGYAQWFVLLPLGWRRWKAYRASRAVRLSRESPPI